MPQKYMKQFSAILLAAALIGCSTPDSATPFEQAAQSFRSIEKGMTRQEVYAAVGRPTTINPSEVRGLDRAYPGLKESGSTVEQWLVAEGYQFAELVVAFGANGKVLANNVTVRTAKN